MAFQLLEAVAQAHGAGVCHGDITCENVLVTSWNWVFLSDFASYKPTTLPADNPVRSSLQSNSVAMERPGSDRRSLQYLQVAVAGRAGCPGLSVTERDPTLSLQSLS